MHQDREACCPKTQEVWSPEERGVGSPGDRDAHSQQEGVQGSKMEGYLWTSEVNEVKWLLHVLLRQADVEEKARSMQVNGCVPRGVVSAMPTPIKVCACHAT